MTRTTPRRLTILQLSQIRFTDALTFMVQASNSNTGVTPRYSFQKMYEVGQVTNFCLSLTSKAFNVNR